MLADLDRFKAINNTYGHPVGDLMLKAITGRLTNCLRSADTLARVGGDEFVIIL
jgi:diguanylate cyclase (GGDEF)-like protein